MDIFSGLSFFLLHGRKNDQGENFIPNKFSDAARTGSEVRYTYDFFGLHRLLRKNLILPAIMMV